MKELKGQVISVKTAKTAVVIVKRQKIHPLYQKRMTVAKKYQVHDEIGVKVGDWVKFRQSRPFSKKKRWQITEVSQK